MTRPTVISLSRGFVAFALALLLPLEASHCMWMGATATAATPKAKVTASADPHDCCAGPDAPASEDSPGPARDVPPLQCLCLELPPATTSPVVVTPPLERVAAIATLISFPVHPLQGAHRQPIDLAESPPPEIPPDVIAARGPPTLG